MPARTDMRFGMWRAMRRALAVTSVVLGCASTAKAQAGVHVVSGIVDLDMVGNMLGGAGMLRSTDFMSGGSLGLSKSLHTWAAVELGVQVSGAVGMLRPTFKGYDQIDGFDVITDDVSFTRATLGLTYRF